MKLTAARISALSRKYGLSESDFHALLDECGGRCHVCARRFTATRTPHVDHMHEPPFHVRGLLCARCNYELFGRISEDPEFFHRAYRYLSLPPALLLPGPPRRPPDSPTLIQ